jgi:hypothetical protein
MPSALSTLARPHAEMGQHEKAWHSIGEAITAVETQVSMVGASFVEFHRCCVCHRPIVAWASC